MKRTILFVALLLVPIVPLSAQAQQDTMKTSLVKGARAMQFRVAPNFTLATFDGATFSGKWHVRDNRAIRFGVDLRGSVNDVETKTVTTVINSNVIGSDNIDTAEEHEDGQSITVVLNGYYVAYPRHGKIVNLYTGIGPTLSWRKASGGREITSSNNQNERTTLNDTSTESTSWRAGLGFIMGLEWFMHPSMSLTAEYGFFASFALNDDESEGEFRTSDNDIIRMNESDTRRDQLDFGGIGVRFGLSVYF